MTGDGQRTFTWDAENRLASVTILATGHVSQFTYDEFGRRVEIAEKDNGATTNDTKYLWEGTEIAESRTSAGGTVLQHFYAQGFVDSDGTNLYYTRDHLGSVRELTDSSQVIRARYDYDPYGRMTKISGDKDSPFLYTGHLWHPYSGLYLTLYREYDANLGRWISRDPIQENGGIDIYRYVNSDPIRYMDPHGLIGGPGGAFPWSSPNDEPPSETPLGVINYIIDTWNHLTTEEQRCKLKVLSEFGWTDLELSIFAYGLSLASMAGEEVDALALTLDGAGILNSLRLHDPAGAALGGVGGLNDAVGPGITSKYGKWATTGIGALISGYQVVKDFKELYEKLKKCEECSK